MPGDPSARVRGAEHRPRGRRPGRAASAADPGYGLSFDELRRELDASGAMQAMDEFEAQALELLTSPEAAGLRPEPGRPEDAATATAGTSGGSSA